jgi:hypothetical protein
LHQPLLLPEPAQTAPAAVTPAVRARAFRQSELQVDGNARFLSTRPDS